MAPRKRYKDPHADREASKYENPVPSRELILQVLDDQGKPLGKHDLAGLLDVDEDGEVGLERRLKAMLRDGQLVENRNGKVGIASRMDLIAGRVQGHRDGFGFLIADEPGRKDLFLAPRQMEKVMDGDRVLVPGPEERVAARLLGFLKTHARSRLAEASDRYSARLGRGYARLTLRDTRSRWGSCTADGGLMYSWRLILAPPEVLEYVAAHEVAHLQEMNHSADFWALVTQLYGPYQAQRRWLHREGAALHRIRFT